VKNKDDLKPKKKFDKESKSFKFEKLDKFENN